MTVALLAIVVLLLVPLPASLRLRAGMRENMLPFQTLAAALAHAASRVPERLADNRRAADERIELLTTNAALRLALGSVGHLRRENTQLWQALGYTNRWALRLRFCRVIGRDETSGWWRSLHLDHGAEDGLRESLPVVTPDGLVGLTTSVTPRTCDVRLISDPQSRVPCTVVPTGSFGILKGMGASARPGVKLEMLLPPLDCQMDYVSHDPPVATGGVVVTSSLGGVFPDGLPVGRIRSVGTDSSGLYQRLAVSPFVAMASPRFVFVVLPPEAPVKREKKGENGR
jgi:rod shape-determining protein MreC